jgi:hypothetical protein
VAIGVSNWVNFNPAEVLTIMVTYKDCPKEKQDIRREQPRSLETMRRVPKVLAQGKGTTSHLRMSFPSITKVCRGPKLKLGIKGKRVIGGTEESSK